MLPVLSHNQIIIPSKHKIFKHEQKDGTSNIILNLTQIIINNQYGID